MAAEKFWGYGRKIGYVVKLSTEAKRVSEKVNNINSLLLL